MRLSNGRPLARRGDIANGELDRLSSRVLFAVGLCVAVVVLELLVGAEGNLVSVWVDVRDADTVLGNVVKRGDLLRELRPSGAIREEDTAGEAVGGFGDLHSGEMRGVGTVALKRLRLVENDAKARKVGQISFSISYY